MVVFTCNACSAVLKRNQVDTHCYRCRGCESLSCVDCGKDFWGDDYQQHTKCISEEEKYGGKNVAPKVNKGEVKQEQWVEQVQAAIEKASSKPKLKGLLQRLVDYSNIPRKKAKFENFVKNSLRVNNPTLVAEVWDVLMANNNKVQPEKTKDSEVQNSKPESESITNGHEEKKVNGEEKPCDEALESSAPKTKSKREKKEERRKNTQKKEKKDRVVETTDDLNNDKPKKSKKRKRQELENTEDKSYENEGAEQINDLKKIKNKKGADKSSESIETADNDECNGDSRLEREEEEPPRKRKKTKFDWDMVIVAVLQKKGELSLKKLKKKVLSEFAAQDAANFNEENLSAKFDKKVIRIPGVKVYKDRAVLKDS